VLHVRTPPAGQQEIDVEQMAHGKSARRALTTSGVIGGAPGGATRTLRPCFSTSLARLGWSRCRTSFPSTANETLSPGWRWRAYGTGWESPTAFGGKRCRAHAESLTCLTLVFNLLFPSCGSAAQLGIANFLAQTGSTQRPNISWGSYPPTILSQQCDGFGGRLAVVPWLNPRADGAPVSDPARSLTLATPGWRRRSGARAAPPRLTPASRSGRAG